MRSRDHAAYWDAQAAGYDRRTAWVERRFLAASRRWVCERARGRTLEVAIGTGANLPHHQPGPRTGASDEGLFELVGLDQSPKMMHLARARAEGLGLAVELHLGDATSLPFGDESFDSYVCTYALCSIPDVALALTEAVRVLRPGGRLLLADHVAATNWALLGIQRMVNVLSVPLQGESYTRRPMNQLAGLDVTVVESGRLHQGAIERILAHKGI